MLEINSEANKLFSKSIPIAIKEGHTNHHRNSKLLLTVEWLEISAAMHRKELKISLTDNNDPFFLYNLHLSEEDFQTLKSSQGILVDFSAFPQNVIDFLEVCLAEENKAQPKFVLIFNMSEKVGNISSTSQLDVVETSPFKHLTHLSLKFVVATESAVKQYSTTCFKNLKEEKKQLLNRLTYLEKDLQDKLSTCQANLEKKSEALETMRKEMTVELSMKESRHVRELQEERDKFLNRQRDVEMKTEKERREKEAGFRKEIQQLDSRISCLDTLNRELQDQNYKRDSTIRDLRSRILSLEEETKRSKDSLRHVKEQKDNLESELREKRLLMGHQRDKIGELEQEVTYKKQHIAKLQEQTELLQKQEKALKKELEEITSQLHKSIKTCNESEEQLIKAHYVMDKYRTEMQSEHEKLKRIISIASEHEQSVSEKEKIIQMLQKELNNIKIDVKRKIYEAKHLSDSVKSLQEKNSLLEKDMKARDNVITYLNHKLTDRCIIPQYVPPSNLTVTPNNVQALKMNASGEPCKTNLNNSPSVLGAEKSTLSARTENSPLQNGSNSLSSGVCEESAYPSSNTKDSNYRVGNNHSVGSNHSASDMNANPDNFDVNSAALNAAFGTSHVLKHSTTKKQTITKTGRGARKMV